MTPLYQILGIVASICNRSSKTRVNGMPLHCWILIGCLFATLIGASIQLQDSQAFGHPPTSYSAQNVAMQSNVNQYVTVKVVLDTASTIVVTEGQDTSYYAPLFDPKRKQGVLVKLTGPTQGPPATLTVAGMIRPIDSELTKSLDQSNGLVGKVNVTDRFAVEAGSTPTNPEWFLLTFVITVIPSLLIAASILFKHVIYQKTTAGMTRIPSASVVSLPIDKISVRFSGKLTLTPKISQRFLNMTAFVTKTDDDKLAIVSPINASVSTEFGRLIDRSGLWAAIIKPNSLRPMSKGILYLGTRNFPSLHISYIDVADTREKLSSSVLSFESEDDRDAVWDELQKSEPAFSAGTQQ